MPTGAHSPALPVLQVNCNDSSGSSITTNFSSSDFTLTGGISWKKTSPGTNTWYSITPAGAVAEIRTTNTTDLAILIYSSATHTSVRLKDSAGSVIATLTNLLANVGYPTAGTDGSTVAYFSGLPTNSGIDTIELSSQESSTELDVRVGTWPTPGTGYFSYSISPVLTGAGSTQQTFNHSSGSAQVTILDTASITQPQNSSSATGIVTCSLVDVRLYKEAEYYFMDICNRPLIDLYNNQKCIASKLRAIDFPTTPATATSLGLVKVGSGLSVTSGGVLSKLSDASPPYATSTTLGIVKMGAGLLVDGSGTVSVDSTQLPIAGVGSSGVVGLVKSGNTTGTTGVLLDPGTSVVSLDTTMIPAHTYTLPHTPASVLSGLRVGTGLAVNSINKTLNLDYANLTQALDATNTTKVVSPAVLKQVLAYRAGTIAPGTLINTTSFPQGITTYTITDSRTHSVQISVSGASGNVNSQLYVVYDEGYGGDVSYYGGNGGNGGLCVKTIAAVAGESFTLQVGVYGEASTCYSSSPSMSLLAGGGGYGGAVDEVTPANGVRGTDGAASGGDVNTTGGGATPSSFPSSYWGYPVNNSTNGWVIIKEYS